MLQKDRTVKTASAVAKSLSHWLSQQNLFFFSLFWALRTHHISPAIPWSLHTHPNQLSRGGNAGLGLGVIPRIQSSGWLSKRDGSYTATQNTQCLSDYVTSHCFIEHSVFILPQSTLSLLHNEKCKSASGWSEDIGPLFQKWSKISWQIEYKFSTSDSTRGWAVPGRLLKHRVEFNKVQFGYSWKKNAWGKVVAVDAAE